MKLLLLLVEIPLSQKVLQSLMFLTDLQIPMENLLQFFGSVTSVGNMASTSAPSTDTIAGETTSSSGNNSSSSTIDVVGLAVFKGDVLVR